jgi:hypothetical protein
MLACSWHVCAHRPMPLDVDFCSESVMECLPACWQQNWSTRDHPLSFEHPMPEEALRTMLFPILVKSGWSTWDRPLSLEHPTPEEALQTMLFPVLVKSGWSARDRPLSLEHPTPEEALRTMLFSILLVCGIIYISKYHLLFLCVGKLQTRQGIIQHT